MSEWKAGGKAMVDLVQGPGDAHTFHIPSSGGPYFLVSASALQPVADPPWREDDENTHKQKLEKALAAMIVSPWREIDDEARNGEPWLVATKRETSGKWVCQLARYIPRYTEQNDEDFAERCEENDEYYTPEGWYEMCYEHDEYIAMGMKEAPTLYAPIPELPK